MSRMNVGCPLSELEFRDGTREVADYIRDLLYGVETHRFTFQEALQKANAKLLNDHIGEAQRTMLKAHFRENGGTW